MGSTVDAAITDETLAQFVSEYEALVAIVDAEMFDKGFAGDKSHDFYEGLLTGYANAFYLANMPRGGGAERDSALSMVVAFVASKVSDLRGGRALSGHLQKR